MRRQRAFFVVCSALLATGLGSDALLSGPRSCHNKRATLLIAKVVDARAAPSVAVDQTARTAATSSLSRLIVEARSTQAGELGLAAVNGVTVALLIKHAKLALGRMEALRARAPLAAPLVGAAFVCLLYLLQPDLATGAGTIGQENAFSFRRQALRFLAVLVAVGSGSALALAGPAAEAGMAVARVFSGSSGRDLPRARALILSGAAAGFAANFDAPLAGVLYALEVSRRTINLPEVADDGQGRGQAQRESREVSVLMVAAFSAAWVLRGGRAGLSAYSRGALALSQYPPIAAAQYPLLLLVAAAAALITGTVNGPLTRTMGGAFRRLPVSVRPLAGGGAVAIAQMFGFTQSLPHIYVAYGDMIKGALSGAALVRFTLIKLLAVAACTNSGLVGGVIAPFLLVGTALGALVGSGPGAASFGAVGSAAVLASFFSAPLTFAVLLVEMTQSLHLLVPLLLTSAMSAALGDSVARLGRREKK